MGLLVSGVWQNEWYDTKSTGGAFERSKAAFRNWVTADGQPGSGGTTGYAAESGRYHLYVSYACPWAHRTLIYRALRGLVPHISISVVHPDMREHGWTFEKDETGASGDTLLNNSFLRDVYLTALPDMTGRVTVPILWDKHSGTIVSNESSEIIRMFDDAFNDLTGNTHSFRPPALCAEIDTINERTYEGLNNGVYKAGFATTQAAYDRAVTAVFETLDWMEDRLSRQRYLAGDVITEADWRVVTTLFRFDPVYHGHFKCSRNKLIEFPNIWAYARELYQVPGIAETVNFYHIRRHYHCSHDTINPNLILPMAPELNWSEPHGRDQTFA